MNDGLSKNRSAHTHFIPRMIFLVGSVEDEWRRTKIITLVECHSSFQKAFCDIFKAKIGQSFIACNAFSYHHDNCEPSQILMQNDKRVDF